MPYILPTSVCYSREINLEVTEILWSVTPTYS